MSSAPQLDWRLLAQGTPQAHELGSIEATLLARALAVCDVVQDRDGTVADISRRTQDILQTIWPKDPLAGFALHSSPGAYVVARVAVDLVPARGSLRGEPLDLPALLEHLEELGVEPRTAVTVLDPWDGAPPDFTPEAEGLPPSILAGLAERSLSRQEHGAALDQVVYSPRCLQRLASTINLLSAVRVLLPMMPPEALGDDVWAVTAAVALGRPDRALEMVPHSQRLCVRTWQELARATHELHSGGELSAFDSDDLVLPSGSAVSPFDADQMMDGGDTVVGGGDTQDVEDDILDIVEEGADDTMPPPPPPDTNDLDAGAQADASEGPLAHRSRVLGLLPASSPESVPDEALPMDPRLTSALDDAGEQGDQDQTERIAIPEVYRVPGLQVDRRPHDAYFPPVRAAIRAALKASEGATIAAPEEEGHVAWAWARCQALSLVVQGNLQQASEAVADLPARLAPEGRWAADLQQRFGDREPEAVSADERRSMAAALLHDLAHQLARTVAGTTNHHG